MKMTRLVVGVGIWLRRMQRKADFDHVVGAGGGLVGSAPLDFSCLDGGDFVLGGRGHALDALDGGYVGGLAVEDDFRLLEISSSVWIQR
jgi:hypothetical protein